MEHIDINFAGIGARYNRHQVLQKYTTAMMQLRAIAEQTYRVSPFYFDNYILWQYFQQRSAQKSAADIDASGGGSATSSNANDALRYNAPLAYLKLELLTQILHRRRQIIYSLFCLMLGFLCVFAYRHDGLTNVPHVHSIVYPGMRMWRRLTLPLIQRFPRLTELYDESCLMENPFFQAGDLSCAPCANADHILDLSRHDMAEQQQHANALTPFAFKVEQPHIDLNDFHSVYVANQQIFQRDAFRVQSSNRAINNLEDLFTLFNQSAATTSQSHHLWRCNRMQPARLLRQLFVRPTPHLPTTGVALERYIAIDTDKAPAYTLPDTKCANAYVQQALGSRFIILRPTSECRHKCRTLSMRLPQSYVLSYNWWYWKPISAPDPVADTLSISLIGSYC